MNPIEEVDEDDDNPFQIISLKKSLSLKKKQSYLGTQINRAVVMIDKERMHELNKTFA